MVLLTKPITFEILYNILQLLIVRNVLISETLKL